MPGATSLSKPKGLGAFRLKIRSEITSMSTGRIEMDRVVRPFSIDPCEVEPSTAGPLATGGRLILTDEFERTRWVSTEWSPAAGQ